MTREEMLAILHKQVCLIELTALPSEGALEVELVTHFGHSYEWIGMNEWPLYELEGVNDNTLSLIQCKLQAHMLSEEDIKNTALEQFWQNCNDTYTGANINEFFLSLMTMKSLEDNLYAIFDPCVDSNKVLFFPSIEELTEYLNTYWDNRGVAWGDETEEELSVWIDRIDSGFGSDGVPFVLFSTN